VGISVVVWWDKWVKVFGIFVLGGYAYLPCVIITVFFFLKKKTKKVKKKKNEKKQKKTTSKTP